MSIQQHVKVLIVGGSVAGLTLANTLEQLGIDYLVLEKYAKIAPDLGASIGIFPNGYRILDQLGLYDAMNDLNKDAYESFDIRGERGEVLSEIKDAFQQYVDRLGYGPGFIERRMVIQLLYDNIQDKSKILTRKGIAKVEQSAGMVKVITEDGTTFSGDVLVGADGVHSTVRREMWRNADEEKPGYFTEQDRSSVRTEYRCIFGISRPNDKMLKKSWHMRQGQNFSYLVVTGPNEQIYWALFSKLSEVICGSHDKVPRYTEVERDALAAEHAQDPLTDNLTFGDIYETRTAATLQALPEVNFKKWHFNRIITIGDAAHKFNPLGGQGGNHAIEDAAVLADQLYLLFGGSEKHTSFTDADITQAFHTTQRVRFDRAGNAMKDSRVGQSVQAMDKFTSKMIAKYLMPLGGAAKAQDQICMRARGAARVKALPMPMRQHRDLWDDEREPSTFDWKLAGYVTSVGFAVLALFTANTTQLSVVTLSKALLSV
ncbi:FAD binding domain-containing protein [Paraphoma chrysanthemicola]|nr:FAD binding domain-containing protein [Paraphoma chrysanthemicola]